MLSYGVLVSGPDTIRRRRDDGGPRPVALTHSRDPTYTQSRRNHSDIRRGTTLSIQTLQRPTYHGSGAVAFSTKGEYGVRLMVQLGRHYGTGPVSLAGIAAEEDLPRAYLEQLVVNLREAGLVVSTRGAHGGYELARPPEAIAMGEVLRALEGPIAPMICASDDPEHAIGCDRSSRCTVNILWVRVRDAIASTLDSMTLADLVPPRGSVPTTPEGAVTAP
jgi:Rrf2 family protein